MEGGVVYLRLDGLFDGLPAPEELISENEIELRSWSGF